MRYKHDCEMCKPLGEFGKWDLYFCNQGGSIAMPTVVARSSSNYPDNKSGLQFADLDTELKEAKKRAIEKGYLNKDLSSTAILNDIGFIPIQTVNLDGKSIKEVLSVNNYQTELMEYIRLNKYKKDGISSRTKVGMIIATKIEAEYFNEDCKNTGYYRKTPFVIIVHSKVRSNSDDVFNLDKAYDICESKLDYVYKILTGENQRRFKDFQDRPSRDIMKYYLDMEDRSRRYFKDCKEVIMYHDVFNYKHIKKETTVDNPLFLDINDKDFSYKNLKMIIETESDDE